MFKASISGLNGFKAQFASATANVEKIVDGELETMSQEWVRLAQIDVPADQAALKGAITFYKVAPLKYEIVAQKFYAPFMEFGTKGKYQPIPGTEQIAAQAKGYKGGDFMELLRNIVRWVARKGITGTYSTGIKKKKGGGFEQGKTSRKRLGSKVDQIAEDYKAAWPIALSILRNGVKPHPFFFKQMHIVWPKMLQRVVRRVKNSKLEGSTSPKIV